MTQWTDKHYDFNYTLTEKDIEAGSIKLDPYFVAKQWKTGSKDDSGALFHVLKTVARFGDKNDVEREVKALYAQVLGVARSFDVDLQLPEDVCSSPLSREGQLNIVETTHHSAADLADVEGRWWYPDNSGEWKETSGINFKKAKKFLQGRHIEVLADFERLGRQSYRKSIHSFEHWFGGQEDWGNRVAYKIVE